MKSNIWKLVILAVIWIPSLLSNLVHAATSPIEINNSDKLSLESSLFKNEFDFTIYFRIETLIQNRLYKDSGQKNLLDYLGLSVGIDAYYRSFFIESNNRFYQNSQSSTIGYRLVDKTKYQLDILLGQGYLSYLEQNAGNVYREEPSEALAGIDNRDRDFNQGLRFTQFHGNKAWWIDVAGDLLKYSHGGWLFDSYYSQIYQVKNWEVQIGFGATYFSRKMVNYHAGVKAHEVTDQRPLYDSGNGARISFDVSAQYPLSQRWVFITGAAFKKYSSEFSNSPLFKRSHQNSLNMSVMYVW